MCLINTNLKVIALQGSVVVEGAFVSLCNARKSRRVGELVELVDPHRWWIVVCHASIAGSLWDTTINVMALGEVLCCTGQGEKKYCMMGSSFSVYTIHNYVCRCNYTYKWVRYARSSFTIDIFILFGNTFISVYILYYNEYIGPFILGSLWNSAPWPNLIIFLSDVAGVIEKVC